MMDEPADRHVGDGNTSQRGPRPESQSAADSDFLSNILAPGSSLNPAFLLVVDVVLALLSLTLGSLAIATGGNFHLIALLFITLALWVSIKWFVNELQRTLPSQQSTSDSETKKSE